MDYSYRHAAFEEYRLEQGMHSYLFLCLLYSVGPTNVLSAPPSRFLTRMYGA